MSDRRNPKWLGPNDINTELLYSEDEHERAARFYARSGYSLDGTLPWEDAPREIRAVCLESASKPAIRWSMKLDRAELPTTGWRHFLDQHPLATYLTFMTVIMLVAVIVVLATGGAA